MNCTAADRSKVNCDAQRFRVLGECVKERTPERRRAIRVTLCGTMRQVEYQRRVPYRARHDVTCRHPAPALTNIGTKWRAATCRLQADEPAARRRNSD